MAAANKQAKATSAKPSGKASTDPAQNSKPSKVAVKASADHLQVRAGRVLLWPNGTKRGGEGYVVRADDPFIKDYRAVLTVAPDGAKATEVDDPLWERNARAKGYQFGKGYNPTAAKREQKKADVDAEAARLQEGGVEPVDADELPDAEA